MARMDALTLPPPEQLDQRIAECELELKALRRLRRMAHAAHIAAQARRAREGGSGILPKREEPPHA
jgi:hypothetical protein